MQVNLREMKQKAIDLCERCNQGSLNRFEIRYEWACLFEQIKDAMAAGQVFQRVRIQDKRSKVAAIWIDEKDPEEKGVVRAIAVDNVGRVAFFA